MDFDVERAFERVRATLLPALDIVAGRVDDARIPAWCAERGWEDFLLGITGPDLERCEAEGLTLALATGTLPGAPPALVALAAAIREATHLPKLVASPALAKEPQSGTDDYRGVGARKRAQLIGLLGALPSLAEGAKRIVDVGAGSGHFTRLAASHFSLATLGLERNPARVESAVTRAREARKEPLFAAEFTVLDACREELRLRADDLAIGLHACGELGDALVTAVAANGADLALISCCLQQISVPVRTPLSSRGLSLDRETLGLSNLTSQARGVEADIQVTMRARQARYALRCLLLGRGLEVPPGSEMRGINRRRAHAGLADIADRALALRGLARATASELGEHERAAAAEFEVMRRLSLPRNMLARVVELSVVLDRALRLQESGAAVCVAALFDRAVTPRNIGLFASTTRARLPRIEPVNPAEQA